MNKKTCITKQGFTGEDLREFKEFKEKAVKECKASTQATDEDVLALKMHEAPTTRSAKCLSACVLEKLGSVRMTCVFTLKSPQSINSVWILDC